MAEKGLNDASRGGWIMHRDGMRNASRGKKIFITMEKNQPREAGNWNIFHTFAAKILTINF